MWILFFSGNLNSTLVSCLFSYLVLYYVSYFDYTCVLHELSLWIHVFLTLVSYLVFRQRFMPGLHTLSPETWIRAHLMTPKLLSSCHSGRSVSSHDVENLRELSISHGGDTGESVCAGKASLSPLRRMDGDARCELPAFIPGYGFEAHDVMARINFKTFRAFCNPLTRA